MRHNQLQISFWLLMIALLLYSEISGQTAIEKKAKIRWEYSIQQPFIASPVIDGARVFVGGLDSVVYALDLKSGKKLWRFRTNGPLRSTVKIENERLFFSGGDASVYCVDKTTGKKIWSYTTLGGILGERRYDPADYFDSAPSINEGRLYVGGGDGRFYCLNANDGKLIWTFLAGDIIHTSPVISGARVVFGASDGVLYCLNSVDGSVKWKFKSAGHRYFPKGEMQGSPVVFGSLVFIGSRDYNLYAVDLESGYAHWNKQFPLGWATALTAMDSTLYAGTSDDRLLLALDPATGREKWRTEMGFNIFGPPSVSVNTIHVGTQLGKLFEVNAKSGAVNWIFTTHGYQKNRHLYFKEDDSFMDDIYTKIKGFHGYLQMLYRLGAIYSTPAVTTKEVVISTSEGIVYCIER
jgi:eukaryotic-like serine/threonine-protein kinase